MELRNPSTKSARIAEHGKGPRTCVTIRDEEERGSSTAGIGIGIGQRCCSSSFTFLQLQELQHQVLIYKYMETGLPVPIHLLIPLCKSLANSFPALEGLGFKGPLNYCEYRNNSMEAEPGRCRRTDGKKWRCSKNVVNPDQKYCQKHLHRGGRRRQQQQQPRNSRKIVLNQSATISNTNSDTNLSISVPANQLMTILLQVYFVLVLCLSSLNSIMMFSILFLFIYLFIIKMLRTSALGC